MVHSLRHVRRFGVRTALTRRWDRFSEILSYRRSSDAAQTLRHSHANAAVAPAHTSGGMTAKLDPLLGLDFRNVLRDALCAERGLARRLSRLRWVPSR